MAVRRRRPLVPPPYPRRNRYTPLSSGQTALTPLSRVSLRLSAIGQLLAALPLYRCRIPFTGKVPYRFVAPPLPRESASLGFARSLERVWNWDYCHVS